MQDPHEIVVDEERLLAEDEEVGGEIEELSSEEERHLDYMREMAERDFFYFSREVLGFKDSKISWREKNASGKWKRCQRIASGDRYGISRYGPHSQMVQLLLSDSEYKHLEAPRGSYKTTLTMCWLIWLVLKDRNLRVLYLMDTMPEAKKKVRAIREQIEKNEMIALLWPDFQVESKGEKGAFTVSGRTKLGIVDPTFEAGGVDSDMTGSHRDIIVMDDVVNFLNIRTAEGILKTRAYFDMAQPLLDPGGTMLVIGTRYDDSDLYGDILRTMDLADGGEWECLVLSCGMKLVQDENKFWVLTGKPTFAHLDEHVLTSKLRSMDHVRFSSQYLNRCQSSEEQIFFRYQFGYEAYDERWMLKMRWHIVTDTSTSEKEKSCYRVVGLVGLDSVDTAYLADLRVGRWPPQDTPKVICDLFEEWTAKGCKVAQVLMENISLNQQIRPQLEAEMRLRQIQFRITAVPRGTSEPSKQQRIGGLALRFEQGRFRVLDTVPRFFNDGHQNRELFDPAGFQDDTGARAPSGELVDEFIRFPRARFNDIPDALADIDYTAKNSRRYCMGSGNREDLRKAQEALLRARGAEKPKLFRAGRPAKGSRWDKLWERTRRA